MFAQNNARLFWDNAASSLKVSGSANALNLTGSATGNPVTLSASGSDAKVAINLIPKGEGSVHVGPVNSIAQINPTLAGGNAFVVSGNGSDTYGGIAIFGDRNVTGAPFILFGAARGSITSPTASQANDGLMFYEARGYGTTGFRQAAYIEMHADGAFTDSSSPGYIVFATTPAGSNSSLERMRIRSGVHIGPANSILPTNSTLGGLRALQISGDWITQGPEISILAADGWNARLKLASARGTLAVPTVTAINDIVGQVEGLGYSGTNFRPLGFVAIAAEAAPTESSSPGRIEFWTTPVGAVNGSRRMQINSAGDVLVGTGAFAASAQLQSDATTKGWLPTRWTTTQRDAIATPAEGLFGYNLTTQRPEYYNGAAWGAYADLSAAVILAPASDTRNVIQPTAATVKALVLKGFASQIDSLLECQASDGTPGLAVKPLSYFNWFGAGLTSGLVIQGTVDQTTNYHRLAIYANTDPSYNIDVRGAGTGANTNLRIWSRNEGDSYGTGFTLNPAGSIQFQTQASELVFTIRDEVSINFRHDVRVGGGGQDNYGIAFTDNGASGVSVSNSFTSVLYRQLFNPTSGSVPYAGVFYDISINQTGSASGSYTALKLNVTETSALGTNKLLMDLRRDGTSQFKVDRAGVTTVAGQILAVNGDSTNPGFAFASSTNTGFKQSGGTITFVNAGNNNLECGGNVTLGSGVGLYWNIGTYDLSLFRDAADTLAQRRGTNAQNSRVYNKDDGAGNTEYLQLGWSGDICIIGPTKTGSGTPRSVNFHGANFNFLSYNEGTYQRVALGDLGLNAGTGRLSSAGDGLIRLSDSNDTDFGRLQFGGTTSSFPALKKSGTTLQVRLADDSAFADLSFRNVIAQSGYTEMVEMTAPSAGAANTARLFVEDNGSGKSRMMVQFASGAAQQVTIEP